MMDPVDTRFFTLLVQDLAEDAPPPDSEAEAVMQAAKRALETGAPLDLLAARRALDGLEPGRKDRILSRVHAGMARDLSAIWDQLPQGFGRPGDPRKLH